MGEINSVEELKELLNNLYELALPISKFLQEKYDPNTQVVVTSTGVELLLGALYCPIDLDEHNVDLKGG